LTAPFVFADSSVLSRSRLGDQRDRRQLKHRSKGDTRTAPICPELAKLPRWHTEEFGYSSDGKLFTGVKGGELPLAQDSRNPSRMRPRMVPPARPVLTVDRRTTSRRHAAGSTMLTARLPAQNDPI
jgi:hypothetical protein